MAVPFTYRQLEVFVAVARHGSIAGAADSLLSSPSAVSAALTELEKSVGVTLFERVRSKGVRLTTHGELLRVDAARLLEESEMVAAAVGEQNPELTGTIRLGAYSSLSSALLPIVLASYAKEHPAVTFELRDGNQNELQDMFDKGEIDIALTYNRFLTTHLKFQRVQRRYPYVLLAKDHPLAGQKEVTLKELADDDFILLDLHPSRENTLSWFEDAEVTPKISWTTKEPPLARALVGGGLGYTVLLQPYGHNLTVDGSEVVPLPLVPRPAPIDIFVAWRTLRSGEPLRIRSFVDHVTKVLAEFPDSAGHAHT